MILESVLASFVISLATIFSVAPDGNIVADTVIENPSDDLFQTSQEELSDLQESYEADNLMESLNPSSEVSDGDISGGDLPSDKESELISLLSQSVSLLSENSASVTGTVNSTVLDLMDRMVNGYPDRKYIAFRTDTDDSYKTTLFLAKRAKVNGKTVTFSEDCIAVHFYRYYNSSSYGSGYLYYTVSDSPSASVTIGNQSIVYTNTITGYPTLGDNPSQVTPDYLLLIAIFACILILIFKR